MLSRILSYSTRKIINRLPILRITNIPVRKFADKKNEINYDVDLNKPISYSKSRAATWRAEVSRTGIANPALWYEPYVLMASIVVFLVYFCVLREENDIDEELGKTLYDRISGLEETQLQISLAYNEEHNLDTSAIKNRLKEIQEEGPK